MRDRSTLAHSGDRFAHSRAPGAAGVARRRIRNRIEGRISRGIRPPATVSERVGGGN